MQGSYNSVTPILDVQEGQFVKEKPLHPFFLEGGEAEIASRFMHLPFYNELEKLYWHPEYNLNKEIKEIKEMMFNDITFFTNFFVCWLNELRNLVSVFTIYVKP